MTVRGALNTMAVLDLLEWIDRRELKGELSLERGAMSRRIYFAYGCVTGASSTNPAEFLGQILVNAGRLTEEKLGAALTRSKKSQISLGKTLLADKTIDEIALRAALDLKIRESVYEAMSWPDGTFVYEPERVSPKIELEIALPLRDLMLEGQSRAKEWRAVKKHVADDDQRFYVPDREILARALAMPEPRLGDASLLVAVSQDMTVRDIILANHATPFQIFRDLAELVTRGVIKRDRRRVPRSTTVSADELPAQLLLAADERVRANDRVGALTIARRALDAAPGDEEIKHAYQMIERGALAELTRAYLTKFRVPKLTKSAEEILALDLTAEERYFVGRIDGRWDLLSLMRVAPLREIEALLTIRKLATRGLITLEE
jgi:hypothetical protein